MGMLAVLVVEHHGSLGFIVVVASCWDGEEAMCVG